MGGGALAGGVAPVVLFALAGVLVGGAISMHRQGARHASVVLLGVLAALAGAGGALWLLPAL